MSLLPTRPFPVDKQELARELSSSERKLNVFKAVYSGGSKAKDARRIARMVGSNRVAVLQVASPMAHKGYFESLKVDGLTCFKKYREINAIRDEVLRLARNRRRLLGSASNPGGRESPGSAGTARSKKGAKRPGGAANRYEVVLSFAGEDRKYAEQLAGKLKRANVPVFYDKFEKAKLWGRDLYSHLKQVYGGNSRFCVVFVSESYRRKLWTRYELRSAQERAFKRKKDYILPVKVDDCRIPSLFTTTGFLDLRVERIDGVFQALLQKLGRP